MTIHDSMAKQLIEKLLEKWKINNESKILSNEVFLTKSENIFLSPDGTFYDPKNKFSLALEFKPPTETKRGILTGLGQSIAYLDKHSLAYLAIPSKVEYFNMRRYMVELFQQNISNKMPIALVIYDYENIQNILEYIEPTVEVNKTTLSSKEAYSGRYWAKWLDLPLHALWILTDIAYLDNISDENRKKAIWDRFFLNYIYPEEHRNQFEPYSSNIFLVNGRAYQPMKRKLATWKKRIDEGSISREVALQELQEATNIYGKGDILYQQYRKNFFPFIDHLGIWDEYGYLTDIGYEVHRIGKIHGGRSKTFYDHIAKVILLQGKHLDLILDIEKYTRNQNFNNKNQALDNVIRILKNKGLIKGSGIKRFQNELQLWVQLGVIKKEKGQHFTKNNGFNFDWERITSLLIEE